MAQKQKKKDFDNINLHEFQQPINSCNLTSIAFALTALGFKTGVNDVFCKAKIPVGFVTNDGMTLSETWEVSVRYVQAAGIPVLVECYHFDADVVNLNGFVSDMTTSLGDTTDILVANFSVKIAHSWTTGGGHYALVADFDPESKLITMAEVHPKKYGRNWTCSAEALFNAMVDKDSSSARARGLIRFIKLPANPTTLPAPLPALRAASRSISWNFPELYKLEKNSVERSIDNMKMNEVGRNVGDVACVGECGIGCLVDADVHVDDILQVTGDYLKVLSNSLSAKQVLEISEKYIAARKLPVKVSILKVKQDKESLLAALKCVNEKVVLCMKMNDNIKTGSAVLTPPDPALEASIFNKGIHNWNSVISLASSGDHVAILNPQFLIFSRMTYVTVDVLLNAVVDTLKATSENKQIKILKVETVTN